MTSDEKLEGARFVVEVNNEILGNSIRICNLRSLKGFNLVAYELAKRANEDGKKHTAGMWTVYPYERTRGAEPDQETNPPTGTGKEGEA